TYMLKMRSLKPHQQMSKCSRTIALITLQFPAVMLLTHSFSQLVVSFNRPRRAIAFIEPSAQVRQPATIAAEWIRGHGFVNGPATGAAAMLALRRVCCLCRLLKRRGIGHTVRQFSRGGDGQETGMFAEVFKADGNMPL